MSSLCHASSLHGQQGFLSGYQSSGIQPTTQHFLRATKGRLQPCMSGHCLFSVSDKTLRRPSVTESCNASSRSVNRTRAASLGVKITAAQCHAQQQHRGELEDRIREQLLLDAAPPSSYDTAWVAMVPARGSSPRAPAPRFLSCVEWILQSQRGDGSWGLGLEHPSSLGKDALSSTMACVIALATWGVGDEHVRRGLRFIGDNASCITDDECDTPAGFNIIFPGMLELGIGMGLELPLTQANVDAILRLRDVELKRSACSTASGTKAFMAYVAEGLGNLQDWDQVMPYQRKNGSFFNSPSTTAAVAIHIHNDRALGYLDSLITKFGNSVPTAYPLNVYSQLCMVDTLEKMGISQSFACEINNILDMAYRSWLDNDEEIMLDMATCAMAFRLLRMHGYDISSDGLAQFNEESSFHGSIQGYLNDTKTLLELYRASQVQILEGELILENIGSWSGKLLKQQLCSNKIARSVNPGEVEHALKFPLYATLERLEHKRNIESFRTDSFHMLKSAYCCRANEEILALAAHGFRSSQSAYQEELQYIKSWVKEMRLDELKFARVMPTHTLFTAAATMFPPELSEARIAWTQNCLLVTVVDDLFDVAGSREETRNLATLIDRWDAHGEIGFVSDRVEILFRAVYETSRRLGAQAAAVQNRSVIHHIAELWADTARSMMVEAEWRRTGQLPSMEEYMRVAEVSFALGPIVPVSLYFVGPELPEDVVRGPEYGELLRHMNVGGRLLNDLRTYGKESAQGKVNSVALHALRCGGGGSVEAAEAGIRRLIEASRRKLLRLVAAERGAVPRPCRALFWSMCKVMNLFYLEKDGYFSPEEMMGAADAVVLEPLQVRE